MCKTNNVKRVLVPIQFNKAGKKLLRYAWHLSNKLGAELLLLHTSGTKDLTFTQQSRGIQKLRTFSDSIMREERKPNEQLVPFECMVLPGMLRESINDVVAAHKVDMVVMENCVLHQEDENNDPDNAAAIMELVSCPVMVVPCTVTYKKLQNLVFATDFTDQEDHVLKQIADFAEQAQANLTLVQVYTKAERRQLSSYKAAMQKMEQQLKGKNVTFKLLEEEDALEGISDFAENSAANMLILATQDNYLMKRLFSSNYVKTMAYHTRTPILTFRQEKKKPCSGCCTNCAKKKAEQQVLHSLSVNG
ncbi:universal stress protein [Pontibacter locisalis]|uniref:Universal stress protein n=1 Tax=Pontibacter locisalis TaxID=1719035 RepID=A0ABW5IFQ9_9BACT